jgi:amino acid transporter
MALYPTLFVFYLSHLFPVLASGRRPLLLGLGMIVVCTLWNILGARAVGSGSLLLGVVLLGPFLVLTGFALVHRSAAGVSHTSLSHTDILGGILIAMWNYMGWDNTSTIAGDVDRPQRTYPLAMFGSVILVIVS